MSNSILSINSNLVSLKAQRQLSTASGSLSSSFERLSSGLRINKASDDAAGLAVASSLKADTRIYSQGIRNLNDGVSALNIADWAISNLSAIVIRMEELAEQSANGAVGFRQRSSLDAEAQALAKEYFRISRTTDFNGLKLFDGSIQGLSLQTGYGSSASIRSSLGGALGTGTFGQTVSYAVGSAWFNDLAVADFDGNGALDMVAAGYFGNRSANAVWLNNGDGSFRSPISYTVGGTMGANSVAVADLDGNGALDLVIADYATSSGGIAGVLLNDGAGGFKRAGTYRTTEFSYALNVTDLNGDGVLDLVTAGSGSGDIGQASVHLGNGDGTFRSSQSYQTETWKSYALSISDVNRDGILDLVTAGLGADGGRANIRLGNGDGTFKASLSYQTETGESEALAMTDVNGDGVLDLVTAGVNSSNQGYATIRLGNGDGTFRSRLSYQTEGERSYALSMSDVNGDGVADLVTAGDGGSSGSATIRLGNGNGTFRSSLSYQTGSYRSNGLALSDMNGDGVIDLMTAENDGTTLIRLSNTRDGISPILPFSLKTQADALQALPVFKRTLERLSMQRGQLGAFQSRLSFALNTLGSRVLEYKGAQSRVEEVDVANESANLVRQQILQQAASAVLGQATQAPALALMLLK